MNELAKQKERTSKEIMDHDLKKLEYTREDLENQVLRTRGSMRIGMGRIYTAEEWKKKRERVLKTPLP